MLPARKSQPLPGFWIPAYAGMTVGAAAGGWGVGVSDGRGVDSRFRGNDRMGAGRMQGDAPLYRLPDGGRPAPYRAAIAAAGWATCWAIQW